MKIFKETITLWTFTSNSNLLK